MSSLSSRLLILVTLLFLEILLFSVWLDTSALRGSGILTQAIANWGPWGVRLLVTFAVFALVFGRGNWPVAASMERPAVSGWMLAAHAILMMVFAWLSSKLFGGSALSEVAALAWIASGMAAVITAAQAFVSRAAWVKILQATRDIWIFGLAATSAAALLAFASRSLWAPASSLTFSLVSALVRPFAADLATDASSLKLGTTRFEVVIAPECSGLEGVGLVLAFVSAWLWFFRREYRFPQSLLLFPAGVAAVWMLNAVRLAGLFLLGHAGAGGIAAGGFHAQAGWIGFLVVVLLISVASRRVAWLAAGNRSATNDNLRACNPGAVYLVPFLAILAAALVTRAASADFDWLYPLRFFAAASAFWFFRKEYRRLNWSVGWESATAGAFVFAIWMAMEQLNPAGEGRSIADGLAGMSAAGRAIWLGFRTMAAVATVPVAEELAFRGFLMRRLVAADFEAVSAKKFAIVPFVISSLAFGILHGDRWVAGTIAGMVYGRVFLRRGSIGDAAAAHGTTNVLLAIWVFATGSWQLW